MSTLQRLPDDTTASQVLVHGFYTEVTDAAEDVTTDSGVVLAANDDRTYALLINDSDTVIYLRFGSDAEVNRGVRLNANGGAYEMSRNLGNLYRGAIHAIHAGSGNKKLLVIQGT